MVANNEIRHEILPDGESTAKWAISEPGFLGSIRQLSDCARCGEPLPFKRYDEPRIYRDMFKPTMHCLCDDCYDEMPN